MFSPSSGLVPLSNPPLLSLSHLHPLPLLPSPPSSVSAFSSKLNREEKEDERERE